MLYLEVFPKDVKLQTCVSSSYHNKDCTQFFSKSKDRVCFAFSKQKIVCIPDHNSEGLFCFCTLENMYNFSSSSNSNKTYVDKKIFRLFSCIFSFLFCLNFIQNSRYSKLSNIIKWKLWLLFFEILAKKLLFIITH